MALTTLQLKDLMNAGTGLCLDAKRFKIIELKDMARHAKSRQVQLILRNIEILSMTQLKDIANAGRGYIVYDLKQ